MNVRQNRAKAQTKPTKTAPVLPRIEDITPSGEASAVVGALEERVETHFDHARWQGRWAEHTPEAADALKAWISTRRVPLARMVEAVYRLTQSSPVDLPDPDTALNRIKVIQAALDAEEKAYRADLKAREAERRASEHWHESAEASERWAKAQARSYRTGEQWTDTRKAVAGAIRLTRRIPEAMRTTQEHIEPRKMGKVREASSALDEELRDVWEAANAWEVGQNSEWRFPKEYRESLRNRVSEHVRRVLDDAPLTAILAITPSRGYAPPQDEHATVEGFKVIIRDLKPFKGWGVDQRAFLREMFRGLRLLRVQAERYFPEMLHPPYTRHPIIIDMSEDRIADYGGFNRNGTVLINGNGPWDAERFAQVLAHEMGHTAYLVMSGEARAAWDALVSEDGTFHVSELLPLALHLNLDPNRHSLTNLASILLWHSENNGNVEYEWLYHQIITALSEYVEGRHKTGSGHTVGYKPGGSASSSFRTLPMAQVGDVSFPLNPTTAYGGNNPNEALAETFAHYVVSGPRAVNPRVRALFQQIFKGLRRNPDDEDDETPPEGRG